MIFEKNGKITTANTEVWNDKVRVVSDAKEMVKPEGIFLCKGLISMTDHCLPLMEAVSICRDKDIYVGLVITNEISNMQVIEKAAERAGVEDCVVVASEAPSEYPIYDTVELPSETLSGFYFVNADRLCGKSSGDICNVMIGCAERIK